MYGRFVQGGWRLLGVLICGGVCSLVLSGSVGAGETLPGLVVETVQAGRAAAAAGLQPGDQLLTWERAAAPPGNPDPARGQFRTPFDVKDVEIEESPRGPFTITGQRGQTPLTLTIPPGEWRLWARPPLGDPDLTDYEEGRRRVTDGHRDQGIARWREVAARLEAADRPAAAAWLWQKIGSHLARPSHWEAAHAAYDRAIAVVEAAGHRSAAAQVWSAKGLARLRQGDLAAAEAAYGQALAIYAALRPDGLLAALQQRSLGNVAYSQGDFDQAAAHLTQALAWQEQQAPEAMPATTTLQSLGIVAWRRGDMEAAATYHERARAVQERLAPDSLDTAGNLHSLGIVRWRQGDLAAAERHHRRALAIHREYAPGGLAEARSLTSLGVIAHERGDLATAADAYRQALAIQERLDPNSPGLALSLNNLGVVARAQDDLAASESFYLRALAVFEERDPKGLDTAGILQNLGALKKSQGDLAAAETYLQRGLALQEQIAPDSLDVASSLNNLGAVAHDRGESEAAGALYRRALAIEERIAPDSLAAARSLFNLGYLAETQGDWPAAEAAFQRSLTLRERLAPGSIDEAEALYALGRVAVAGNQRKPALDYYQRAITALEAQRGKLGGGESAAERFSAKYLEYYQALIRLLLDLDREAEAFHTLERSRAQGLLAMLAERDLIFTADVPAELERERRMAAIAYDRAQERLGALALGQEPQARAAALEALQELRRHQTRIQERIKAASPRLAALQYAEPLTLARTRAILDPGTLLLAYTVGEAETVLFMVEARSKTPRVARLPISGESLQAQVRLFGQLLQTRDPQAEPLAAELAARLLGPAARRIARAQRLLILPDGPLYFLPFAALADPTRRAGTRRLGEAKPLHTVVSATVYAQLLTSRRPGTGGRVAAFGDPAYPEHGPGLLRSGKRLTTLPATRREVEGIRSLYQNTAATYLGPQATESRALALGRDVAMIHFACHGLVDRRFPLDSALALSIPENPEAAGENGLLQAWEIFERMRIDADLVTLSACDTGLGKEMGGEGIVGLARAFQYAGARSLLVSLWPIADESTATFMQAFYGELKAGAAKDVALQRAQAALRRNPATAAPYYWAPFTLIGDWQ